MEIINETRNFCFEVPPSTSQYTCVEVYKEGMTELKEVGCNLP